MILAYGTFRFGQAEAATTITRQRQLDEAQNPWADLERWQISGKLLNRGGSLATMKAKIQALEAAFSTDGKDLILYEPDGRAETAHALRTRNTFGGVRVVEPPSYPDSSGANLVTYRDFAVTLEALVPVTGTRSAYRSFTEQIQFSGGGPLFHHLEPLVGRPIKQMGKQATVFRAVQSGSAVGLSGSPNPFLIAPPLWPQAELIPQRVITYGSPRRFGNSFLDYPVSWQYTFESAVPLNGRTNVWR